MNDARRHRRMVTEKLRRMGKPVTIKADEYPLAEAKIKLLHSRGMPIRDIADGTGLGRATIGRVIFQSAVTRMHRDNYERLMALEYQEPTERGARKDPTPARRRVQALWLAGYPLQVQGALVGATVQQISKLSLGRVAYVHHDFDRRVALMYDKLVHADPQDFGVAPAQSKRARTHASGRGFAWAGCWDETTIDDPAAEPEWTGMCGTPFGRSIHLREDIPICPPCERAPRPSWALSDEYEFDGAKLVRLMDAQGITKKMLGAELRVHHETVGAWRCGLRRPSVRNLEGIAEFFGIHDVSELTR